MPVFLKKLILLIIVSWIGLKVITGTIAHQPLHALIFLAVTLVADLAIWKWEFE